MKSPIQSMLFTPLKWTFLSLVTCFLVFACKKEKTQWETKVTTPLLTSELSLKNLLKSDNIVANSDSSLKLVFENNLVEITANDVFNIEDSTVEYGSSLQTLQLADDSTTTSVSLGTIGNAAGFGAFLNFAHGNNFTLPALTNVSVPAFQIDNSSLFETIEIETGTMEITVNNGLPVEAVNVQMQLKDIPANGGAVIGSTTFPSIPAAATVTQSIVLDGKTINAQVLAEIISFSTLASAGPVPIDTNDAITATIKIKDIRPKSATAIWPDQNLIDTTRNLKIPKGNGILVKDMVVKQGNIEIDVFSSLQDTIYITYGVPNLTLAGSPFEITTVVPPAPVGGTSSINKTYSFAGYYFLFNGDGTKKALNQYTQNTKVRIQYTGKMKTLSKSDTVYLKARITDVIPISGHGYTGADTLKIGPSTYDFSEFNNYFSGGLTLEETQMDLVVQNGIGAPAQVEIVNLSGTNTISNSTVALSGTAATTPQNIIAAAETGSPTVPVNYGNSTISLNSSNSNAPAFMSNLPHQLDYEMKTILNQGSWQPSASPPSAADTAYVYDTPPNFLFDGYGLTASLNVEVPLSLVAHSLVLADTIPFTLTEDLSESNDALFTLQVENGFGFDATFDMILLDENNLEIDTLLNGGTAKRGSVDASTGKTTASSKSSIYIPITASKLANLSRTKSIKILLHLHSYDKNDPNQKFHKVYSSDGFKLKLIGSTIFDVNF